MHVRRPAHLRFEYREAPQYALENLVAAVVRRLRQGAGSHPPPTWMTKQNSSWRIWPCSRPFPSRALPPASWNPHSGPSVCSGCCPGCAAQRRAEHALHAGNDAAVRTANWWGPSAIVQRLSRWDGVDVEQAEAEQGKRRIGAMIEQNGLPPPEALSLPSPRAASRCRNQRAPLSTSCWRHARPAAISIPGRR
jgi:hypothetical protein